MMTTFQQNMLAEVVASINSIEQRLGNYMPKKDGVSSVDMIYTGLRIRMEHDAENKELSHLGLAIFGDSMPDAVNNIIMYGTERIMLDVLLQDNEAKRLTWMKERDVRLLLESTLYGTGSFKSIERIYPILKDIHKTEILEQEGRYRVFITGGESEQTLRLSLPKDRELLCGTDKKEADEQKCRLIKNFTGIASHKPLPLDRDVTPTNIEGVWELQGRALYIDSLRNNSYYYKSSEGTLIPVYSSEHPKRAVINLLLGIVRPTELTVNVQHRQYGGVSVCWQQPWQHLFAALTEPQCAEIYAACQYVPEKHQCTGILVVNNTQTGALDMLLMSIPQQQLGSDKPTTLDALLYTNIPQHNIYSLFEERQRGDRKAYNSDNKINHIIY